MPGGAARPHHGHSRPRQKRTGPGAASNFVRATQALFAWALDREILEYSPAHKIKTPALGSIKAWTAEQADIAFERLPPYMARA
jgi:hypothetical protein